MVPRPKTSFFMAFSRAMESSRPISNRKKTMPSSPVTERRGQEVDERGPVTREGMCRRVRVRVKVLTEHVNGMYVVDPVQTRGP